MAAATLALVVATSAGATLPGRNGAIVFASDRSPDLRVWHRFAIGVDGSGRKQLAESEGVLSPSGRFRAVAERSDDRSTVRVVTVRTGRARTVATFTDSDVQRVVRDLVWSPKGDRLALVVALFCQRGGSGPCNINDLWVVRADGRGLHEIALRARGPTWAPDGRRLAYYGYVGSDDKIFAAASDGPPRPRFVDLGTHPAWSPRRALIAYARNGLHVSSPDGRRHRRIASVAGDAPPRGAPNGRMLAFAPIVRDPRRHPSSLYVVGAKGAGLRRVAVAIRAGTVGLPAWSPDSRQLAYVTQTSPYTYPENPSVEYATGVQVFVVAASGALRPRQVTHEAPWADFRDLRWARDGQHLLYESAQHANDTELYLIDPDGSGTRALTHDLLEQLDPTWSPDGSEVAFARELRSEGPRQSPGIYALDLRTGQERQITIAGPGRDLSPAWSPDGSEVAFVHSAGPPADAYELRLVQPDGSGLRTLAGPVRPLYPAWSPDGSTIAFTEQSGPSEIFTIGREGGGLRRITDFAFATMPAWSPDGRRIAFFGTKAYEPLQLWTIALDGTDARPLAPAAPYAIGPPAWSPDGQLLVYTRAGNYPVVDELHLIRADGSNDRTLANSPGVNEQPDWAPAR